MTTSRSKSYNQRCPLAFALDHVGDRWSPLIVRELLGGPARFNELREALPGVASNLLTSRLRRLEASRVVERRPQAGGSVYALTALGQSLRTPLAQLGLWGAMAGPLPGSEPQPLRSARSNAMVLQAMLAHGEVPGERRCVEVRLDDGALTVEFGGERGVRVHAGYADEPDGVATSSFDALSDLPVPGPGPTTFEPEPGSESVVGELVHALRTSIAAVMGT